MRRRGRRLVRLGRRLVAGRGGLLVVLGVANPEQPLHDAQVPAGRRVGAGLVAPQHLHRVVQDLVDDAADQVVQVGLVLLGQPLELAAGAGQLLLGHAVGALVEPVDDRAHLAGAVPHGERLDLPVDDPPGRVDRVAPLGLGGGDDLLEVVEVAQVHAVEVADRRLDVARQVDQFVAWHRAREMGPVIERLSERYHQLAREELDRTISKLGSVTDEEKAHLEELTRRIVNKLLHDPIRTLREGDNPHVSPAAYLHVVEKMFKLEE